MKERSQKVKQRFVESATSDKDECKYNTVKAIVSNFPGNSLKWSQLELVWLREEVLTVYKWPFDKLFEVIAYKSLSIQGLHQTLYMSQFKQGFHNAGCNWS